MRERVEFIDCVIVGGGRPGWFWAAARSARGPGAVLEVRADFERTFRGDTIHPAVMECSTASALRTACTSSATASFARCASLHRTHGGRSLQFGR
jgi:hypothetical protein